MKTFKIDVDFYSMEFTVKAKNKADARKKAKARLKKGTGILAHVNNLYID